MVNFIVYTQYKYKMVFRWRADDGRILNAELVAFQVIRTSNAKIPYIFVNFGGGGVVPIPVPPS